MDKHLSLAELNATIRSALEENLLPSYWVVAEIGELRSAQSGHCYLDLVEKDGNEMRAKIRGTIWAYTYRVVASWFESITGAPLAPGMKILAHVVVQFHEVYGISLNIKDIDPNYTLGERARKRQEVINLLQEEGVFTMNHEMELPTVVHNIAIVSSPTAAGYGDFVDQLVQNGYGYAYNLQLFGATYRAMKHRTQLCRPWSK